MSTIKSDAQGFLIGDVLDVSKALLKGQEEGLNTLARMDANLAALVRQRRNGGGRRFNDLNAHAPDAIAGLAPPVIAEPAGRAAVRVASAARKVAAAATAVEASMGAASPAVSARDARGRFIKRGVAGPSGVGGGDRDQAANGGRRPPAERGKKKDDEDGRIANAVKTAVKEGTDKVDPYIEATKEIFEPIGRTWGVLADKSKEKRKEGWYKRILSAIRGTAGKAVQGGATVLSGGAGLLSGLGGMASRLLPMLAGMIPAVLTRVFAPVAALWGAWEVGTWIGEKINDWLVSSGLQDKLFSWVDSMKAGWGDLTANIQAGWDSVVSGFKDVLGAVQGVIGNGFNRLKGATVDAVNFTIDSANQAGSTFASLATSANDWLADKTGIDFLKLSSSAVSAASNGSANVASSARSAGGALGRLIGRHEGGYASFNRGNAGDSRRQTMDFGSMSVGEVMALQSLPSTDPRRIFAVGKYQVIPKTLREAVSALGVDKNEKFTPDLQERIFSEYLVGKKRPAVADFLSGKSDDVNAAVHALSLEFASVQSPYTGIGRYDGIAGNKASLSVDAARAALLADRTPVVPTVGTLTMPSVRNVSALTIPAVPTVAPVNGFGDFDGWRVAGSSSDHVGQDIGDRGIAHIATGGMGGKPR